MGKPTLGMLSGEGWVTDPSLLMSRILTHAYLSDYSQSNIFSGTITSIQYVIAQHGHNAISLSNAMQDTLKRYYSRYFDNVTVVFQQTDFFDEENSSKMNFDLTITAFSDSVKYDLNRVLQVDTTKGTGTFMDTLNNDG